MTIDKKHTLRANTWGLFLIAALGAVLLHGCTGKRTAQPPVTYPDTPQPQIQAPAPIPVYTPQTGAAVSLYEKANISLSHGHYAQAELAIERALRIEPRNAHYWYNLAQVKFGQKQYVQTIQLCRKSKSLAGSSNGLLQLNDTLMQKAQAHLAN